LQKAAFYLAKCASVDEKNSAARSGQVSRILLDESLNIKRLWRDRMTKE
jgi:hypothetical protein